MSSDGRKRMKSTKGIAAEMMVSLVVLFSVGLAWMIFSQVYVVHLFPLTETALQNHTNATRTLQLIETVWNYWPLVPMFGILIWVFIRAQKREFDSGGIPI